LFFQNDRLEAVFNLILSGSYSAKENIKNIFSRGLIDERGSKESSLKI